MASSLYADTLSSSGSDSESDDEPVQRVEHRFAHLQSDEEEEKRIVKSARDKRVEEMQTIMKNLNNHKKIKDMSNIIIDFEGLVKVYEKSCKMNEIEGVPKFYIRCIAELEDFVNESWEKKKEKKDMNKGAAKSLTILKQRVKKYNRDFEEHVKDFREHPENYKTEEVVEEDVSEEDALPSSKVATAAPPGPVGATEKKRPKKSTASESESSSSDEESGDSEISWDSDSDSSSSLEMDLERFKDDPSLYFLKKTTDDSKKDKSKLKKAPKDRAVRKQAKSFAIDDEEDGAWTTVDAFGRPEPQLQAFEKGQDITLDVVLKKLNEILATRGKKGTSTSDQITLLLQVEEKIKDHRLPIGIHLKVLFALISVLFDYEKKHASCMSATAFERALGVFDRLFDLLENNRTDVLVSDSLSEEAESFAAPPFRIRGSVLTTVGILDSEYRKVLQNANGHELEYVDRLRDERRVCALLDRLCSYLEQKGSPSDELCFAYLWKVEHLHYKFDFDWGKRVEAQDTDTLEPNESTRVIEKLCQFIYSHDRTDRLRTRAILCHIYHLALYDNFYRARDLMLMSNLQMSIEHADHSTMILYNRAMVQLGLSAFRQGHIRDAHNALADLMGSGRVRELLAQGLHAQTRYERSPEDEKRERAMQVPYHMHINTELLECVYLVSAMLLEIPTLAAHETDLRWRPISKAFHMALRLHDRTTLTGPPETPRDHVIAAAKAMRIGDWQSCLAYIMNPKMDAKIWDLFFQSARVKKILETKIKEESLRSYLFTYSAVHDSISLDRLAAHFELPKSVVYSIVSKMIINQELAASLEVPSDFLIMHKTERSRLQTLALQLSDKVNSIVEMNEKLSETRGGSLVGNKGSQAYQGPRRTAMRYNVAKFN